MYFVYLLKSLKDNKYYVGQTMSEKDWNIIIQDEFCQQNLLNS